MSTLSIGQIPTEDEVDALSDTVDKHLETMGVA